MANFNLPFSGSVLGHLVDAFQLRSRDGSNVLSGRTASRFFAGERVEPASRAEIFDAFGRAVVAAGLFPRDVRLVVGAALGAVAPEPAAPLAAEAIVGMVGVALSDHWDALVGSLQRYAPDVGLPRLLYGAALRIVTIDLSVRLAGLLWLMRFDGDEPGSPEWVAPRGMAAALRELLDRCAPAVTRDQLAEIVDVSANTVDAWLDTDSRPSDENLQDLAELFQERGVGRIDNLLRSLRLGYGLRHLSDVVVEAVGEKQLTDCALRLAVYPLAMLRLARQSKNPSEVDLKSSMSLVVGTLGRAQLRLPFVEAMLNSVWRWEEDPVWRTAIKAATVSWRDYLGWVATRLPVTADAEIASVLGVVLPLEQRERVALLGLATKDELARSPILRQVLDEQVARGGPVAASLLRDRATDAERRGDLLQAIELARAAVAQDVSNPEYHFRLGSYLWQLGDVEAGLMELEIAVALDPGWDRSQVEIAIVLLNLRRNEDAVARLERARELVRAPSAWLHLHLGQGYERLGRTESAVAAYREVVELEPDHGEALDRLAHLAFGQGDKRLGAELAKRAAHHGFWDVHTAWVAKYYDRKGPLPRPPRATPLHLVQLGDAWDPSTREKP